MPDSDVSESPLVTQQLEPLCVAGRFAAALAAGRAGPLSAHESFYLALAAFAGGELAAALALAEAARQLQPDDAVFAAAPAYLERIRRAGKREVYLNPAGFSAFIRGGSNQRLYQATSAALRSVYSEYSAATLLDIGVGDGMALLPALSEHVAHVIVVEPSSALLQQTADA